MKTRKILSIALVALSLVVSEDLNAQKKEKTVEVGGAAMYPSKNIVENAVNSKDHTTLVAAVKAADLVGFYRLMDHLLFLLQQMKLLQNCQQGRLKLY